MPHPRKPLLDLEDQELEVELARQRLEEAFWEVQTEPVCEETPLGPKAKLGRLLSLPTPPNNPSTPAKRQAKPKKKRPTDLRAQATWQLLYWVGTCTVTVEIAGPTADETNSILLVPDQVRGMAGYVIQQCPGGGNEVGDYGGQSSGIGGFVTSQLENILHWMMQTSAFLQPINPVHSPFVTSRGEFITVTVQRPTTTSKKPGDTDVHVADRVLMFARTLWADETRPAHQSWYWGLAEMMEAKVAEMSPDREDVKWWEDVDPSRRNLMEYSCTKEVQGPTAADCAKLQYQGLGQGTVKFGEGESKFFNQGKSHIFPLSSLKGITLDWNQITTAFDTLVTLCVDDPLNIATGGYAKYSANPGLKVFGRNIGKSRRGTDITGMNALPAGVFIHVWKHSGDRANMVCELGAILRGQQPQQQCNAP
ncbi:MAG: hypothetical protein Q9220_007310 [cf. Caloplaca sp. 1 TL-2023]